MDTSENTRTEYYKHIGAAACHDIHILPRAEASTKEQDTMTRNILLKMLCHEENPSPYGHHNEGGPSLRTPFAMSQNKDALYKQLMFLSRLCITRSPIRLNGCHAILHFPLAAARGGGSRIRGNQSIALGAAF